MSRPTPLSTLPLPDPRGYEAAPASHARASTNAGGGCLVWLRVAFSRARLLPWAGCGATTSREIREQVVVSCADRRLWK